jgi:hypothetical protein
MLSETGIARIHQNARITSQENQPGSRKAEDLADCGTAD